MGYTLSLIKSINFLVLMNEFDTGRLLNMRMPNLNNKMKKTILGWHNINWLDAYNKASAIQQGIVKAVLSNDMKTVYQLQRQLVVSYEARVLAIRKVVTNHGSKTAGVDHQIWSTPESRINAIAELGKITKNPTSYIASPVKRVFIPKPGSNEKRPLGIPTMMDRAVQAVYHMAVDPAIECKSDLNSYGFRKYRSTHDAITTLRSLMDKAVSPQWVFETDISKCFDKIDHQFLMKHTPICDKTVLEQWLKSGIKIGSSYEDVVEGTPQGGIISPMLCNVALNGIESYVLEKFDRTKMDKATGLRPKINVIRYADDLVITGVSEELLQKVRPVLEEFLNPRGLALKEAKTRIVNIHEGLDFLGFHIQRHIIDPKINKANLRQASVLVIQPTRKAIDRLQDKTKKLISKERPLESIIRDLNPVLRGWSEYYRISYHSKEVFITLGHDVWKKMWAWARKKHISKTAKEITRKYLIPGKGHKWTWGKSLTETLFNLAEVTTWVMRPLKLDRNPYLLEHKN